jgi:phosphatidylinositol kinase/protein kinase (PI-3  family)
VKELAQIYWPRLSARVTELFKLKDMYGKEDMTTFPNLKSEDPQFEVMKKQCKTDLAICQKFIC